jgi:hypothetical protein
MISRAIFKHARVNEDVPMNVYFPFFFSNGFSSGHSLPLLDKKTPFKELMAASSVQ